MILKHKTVLATTYMVLATNLIKQSKREEF
jgi:hypothetical protein